MPEQLTREEFAASIKAKYPDYAAVPDAELVDRMLTKHPVYRDRIKSDAPRTRPPGLATIGEMIGDVGVGALKGLGNTAFGLGKLARDYTPVGRISDAILPGAFDQRPPEIVPSNTAQKVGFGAEQIGEFFVPAGAVSRAAKVAQAAGTTLAQSGSPASAGVSGALTAVLPGAGAAMRAASGMKASAEKSVAQALGATKEWAKSEATKLAPQMLTRGIGGSRAAMLETARAKAKEAGDTLNAVYAQGAAAGLVVPGNQIRQALSQTANALTVPNAAGVPSVIPGTERVVRRLTKLDEFVGTLGPDIPLDRAAHIKRTWDGIVSKAGLFGPKATASATDSAEAWAFREASNSFRKILNSDPTIAALNAETGFWTGLKNVLKETEKRTQAQSGGLVAAGTGGAGVIAGAISGDSLSDKAQNAVLGGLAGRQLVRIVQSPAFRTRISGPMKNALADALAAGNTGKALAAMNKITAALPAQVRTVPAH